MLIKTGQLWQAIHHIGAWKKGDTVNDCTRVRIDRHEIILIIGAFNNVGSDADSWYVEFLRPTGKYWISHKSYCWWQEHFLSLHP